MSRASKPMRDLAARLIALEAGERPGNSPLPTSAFEVCSKLQPHLTTLMGKGGFHAVLSRALALAQHAHPTLLPVQVQPDGSLADDGSAPADAAELAEGHVALVAELVGLLAAFIGERLALRLVGEAWPGLSLKDLDSTQEDHS